MNNMTGIENGWVCDVELAKKIILAHFDTSKYYCCSVYEVDGKPIVFVLHESD